MIDELKRLLEILNETELSAVFDFIAEMKQKEVKENLVKSIKQKGC